MVTPLPWYFGWYPFLKFGVCFPQVSPGFPPAGLVKSIGVSSLGIQDYDVTRVVIPLIFSNLVWESLGWFPSYPLPAGREQIDVLKTPNLAEMLRNFGVQHLEALKASGRPLPVVNQIDSWLQL